MLVVPEGEGWVKLQERHPRWADLLVVHGTHATVTAAASTGGKIASELIEVSPRSQDYISEIISPRLRANS